MKRFASGMLIASLFLCHNAYAANTNYLHKHVMDISGQGGISGINALNDNTVAYIEDDDDGTYVYYNDPLTPPDTGGARYPMNDAAAVDQIGHIQDVFVRWKAKASAGTGHTAQIRLYDGTNLDTSYSAVTLGTSLTTYTHAFTTAPDGGAWTWTDVNNLSFDIILYDSGATGQPQVHEVDVIVRRDYSTINPYGSNYTTWKSAIDDFGSGALENDFTLYVYPGRYVETDGPATVTADLAGYTFRVTPSERVYYPTSSTANTGISFVCDWTDDGHEPFFKKTGGTTAGTIIIEGISVDASGGDSGFSGIVLDRAAVDHLIVRNCVLRGSDKAFDGIRQNSTSAGARLTVYNNFIYDWDEGIQVVYNASESLPNVIANNTITSCETGIILGGIVGSVGNSFLYNNLIYGNSGTNTDCKYVNEAMGYGNLSEDATCEDGDFASGSSGNNPSSTPTWTDTATGEDITEYLVASTSTCGIDEGVQPFSSNLVAWWRFEYGTAKTVDSAGNYDLTAVSTPADSFSAQEGYGAVYFAKDTAYKILPAGLDSSFPGYTAGGSDMTISFFYKPDGNGAESYLLSYYTWFTEEKYWRWWVEKTSSNAVQFTIIDATNTARSLTTTATLSGGTNYHIAVTYDKDSPYSATIRIWNVDTNTLVENKTGTLAAFSDAAAEASFYINAALDGASYDEAGTFDDVRIYNTVLTSEQTDLLRDLNKDCFDRPRGTTYDVGAYEYITPRDFYVVSSGGSNANSGLSGSPWADFTNLDNRTLNSGDNVYLDKGSTFDDSLYVRSVGSGDTSTRAGYASVSTYGTGANPIIDHNGTEASGLRIIGYKTDVDNIDVRESKLYNYGAISTSNSTYPGGGITVICSKYIYFDTVTSNYNGINGTTYHLDGWSQTPGFLVNISDEVAFDNCTGNWNDGDGLKALNSSNIDITDCTFNYNGLVGGFKHGHGISLGIGDEQRVYYTTITGTDTSYNGFIGLDAGYNTTIESCTAHYNGAGWSTQQLFICRGTLTGSMAIGDTVTQETTGATGTIYTINETSGLDDASGTDIAYTRAGTSDWISIRPDGYNNLCEDVDDPYGCCTGLDTGTCDFSDGDGGGDYDIEKTDNVNYWTPINDSGVLFKTDPLASGGGIDLTYSDDSLVRYSMANYNKVHPDKADAYGFNIDDGTDGAIIHHCIAVGNDGGGYHTNNSGRNEANAFYNNLAYDNTKSAVTAGGFFLYCGLVEPGYDCQIIMKNNISVLDDNYALYVSTSMDSDLVTIDNNIYWMGSDNDVIIAWGAAASPPGTIAEYKASHVSDDDFAEFKTDTSQEANGQAADPLIYDLTSVGFAFRANSPAIDAGTDLSTELDCTPAASCSTFVGCCQDAYGTNVPIDGDGDETAEWDVGPYEWHAGVEWGKTAFAATLGYDFRGWTEYGWAGTGAITDGDESGSIALDDGEYMYSTVKDTGNSRFKFLTMTQNATGTGIRCWRGSLTKFEATDTSPEWAQYTAPENKEWRYVQLGLVNGESCSVLP